MSYKTICCASRGRYAEDGKVQQNLEVLGENFTNTVTTVTKDNYIIEEEIEMDKREQFFTIGKIVNRASGLGIDNDSKINHMMDIEFAVEQFNMDLERWLTADDINFAHDFVGIYANFDRNSRTFGEFVPRFAQ